MKIKSYSIFRKNSLFKRIFIPMCILVTFIICFIIGIGGYYGILGELNDNSRRLFDQQVSNRAHDLQTTMISKWSNLEVEIDRINEITKELVTSNQISLDHLSTSSADSQLYLEKVSQEVITILRNHGVTGTFLMLSDGQFVGEESKYYPGIYVNDSDPEGSYSSSNSDLLLSRCPVELIDQLNISTDSHWQPSFQFNKDDFPFYKKLFENFNLVLTNSDFSLKDVGCWVQPYKVYGSNTYNISYMIPLVYNQKIYGTVGIEVSFSYLQKMLDYNELSENGNSGYLLALQNDDQTYQSLYLNGPYYSGTIEEFSTIKTTGKQQKYIDDLIYCSPHQLNLYNSNTPYESQQWVLLGLVDKTELYSFSEHLKDVIYVSVFIILLIGTILSLALTRYISKPIVHLAKHIGKTSTAGARVHIEKTNITEIDQLIEAIEKMSNDVLDSSSRFTNIIRLANTNLAGFEIDYVKKELFATDGFFDIFMLHDINIEELTIDEFIHLLKTFDGCATPTQNLNEYIYHIEAQGKQIYLRLQYYQYEEKYIGLVEEISDMIRERQMIEHERDHDVLTNLINRRAFQRQMKKLFGVHTDRLKIAALVMMDLDNLKTINDKYGHDCGDAYIKGAASIFKTFSPEGTIVSRTSGDEFYLFYYGYESKEAVNQQLDELKKGINQTTIILPNQEEVKIHVSGGVAWYPSDSVRFEELQRYSDYAMYSVKRSVKGEIGTFNVSDYENNAYIMKKRLDYHQFIDGRMVTYVFQPIVDIHTGEIFGYEALMRSLHPTLKDTKEIISLAKLEAQLNRIEILTWEEALHAYALAYREGLVLSHQKIFVNSISNQIIPTSIFNKIEKDYFDILHNVVLEVTEDEENNLQSLEMKQSFLKKWHAQVALDDYGSGYNSERNLLRVNPHYVKIDMDIIRDIDKDMDKQKIVSNIVSYCHERNKKVIAEGVETILEFNVVLHLDVDYVQGYLFAKPGVVPTSIEKSALQTLLAMNKSHR